MNIAIGKIGQKLIFNRSSKAAQRSNGNGNVGAYKFFDLLMTMNTSSTFICIGDSDINEFENSYTNYDPDMDLKDIDIGLFMIGINDDENMISIINKFDFPYILFCDDPRCLDSLNKNESFKRYPIEIFGQKNESYEFKSTEYDIKYFPVEFALAYKEKIVKPQEKPRFMSIIANYCATYPRLEIIQNLIGDRNIDVYGKLDKTKSYSANFRGEKTFEETREILKESLFTLIVPVGEKCVTSKYLEAIMLGVFPLFYKDYGYEALQKYFTPIVVIKDRNDLEAILNTFNSLNGSAHITMLIELMQEFAKTLIDGTKLNDMIKETVNDICGLKL